MRPASFLPCVLLLATAITLCKTDGAVCAPFSTPDDVPLGIELLKNGGLELPCPRVPPPEKKVYWDAAKKGGGYYPDWPPGFVYHDRVGSGPVEIDSDVSLEGRNSMRLTCALFGNNGFVFVNNCNLPAREGDVFQAAVYLRTEGNMPMYRSLTIDFGKADGKRETVAAVVPRELTGETEWKKISVTAVAPPGAVSVVGVSWKISNTPMFGACWWDALSLTKLRAAEVVAPKP